MVIDDAAERERRKNFIQRIRRDMTEHECLIYKTTSAPSAPIDNTAAWTEWMDQRIADAVAQERALIIEACGTAIGEMLSEQRAKHRNELAEEVRKLWAIITELQGTMRALDRTIAHTAVTDMPSPLQPRRDN
jgi:hypothetical protein